MPKQVTDSLPAKTKERQTLELGTFRNMSLRPRAGMALFRAVMHNPMDHLTEEFIDKMVESIDAGNFPETAAASLGIPGPLWQKWYDAGCQICTLIQDDPTMIHMMSTDEEMLVMLFQAVAAALAQYEQMAVARIEQAAMYDWAAGAWLLAKKFPNRWGNKPEQSVVINNTNQGVLAVTPQQPEGQWLQTFEQAKIADGSTPKSQEGPTK